MDTMLTLKKWQDGYVDTMKKVEEPVVRFTGDMAGKVARFVPMRPTFMKDVPTMKEFVDNGLKFRTRVVDHQAMFMRKWMKAMDPVFERLEHPHAKADKPAMAMPARKPSVNKQPARRVHAA